MASANEKQINNQIDRPPHFLGRSSIVTAEKERSLQQHSVARRSSNR